ncbi:SUKH-4 family immunity protein [Streptomyces sp. NPDC049915]|uniref:SUKH-4 family immunity protein n=1 Tax=Streptomyces sp. NPDC049915 TaxID=3155510 RepID=UPI003438B39C
MSTHTITARGPDTASGLALDLPPRLLDEEFGAGRIVRFEEIDFPRVLTHEPTRRFLREAGLPEETPWFRLDMDAPLATLEEYAVHELRLATAVHEALPPGAARLIRLGEAVDGTSLTIDGVTGTVLSWQGPGTAAQPLNADVSSLAFLLWLAHRRETGCLDPAGAPVALGI